MPLKKAAKNVQSALLHFKEKLPDHWNAVSSINIKTQNSNSLPLICYCPPKQIEAVDSAIKKPLTTAEIIADIVKKFKAEITKD